MIWFGILLLTAALAFVAGFTVAMWFVDICDGTEDERYESMKSEDGGRTWVRIDDDAS